MNRIVTMLLCTYMLVGAGCARSKQRTTVYLVDVSKSVSPKGFRLEFQAAQDLVDGLHRGDRLIVIPITGDAVNDTSGRILYFDAPATRQPYDYDLISFRKCARQRLEAMQADFSSDPADRTDVFGALRIAAGELNRHSSTRLVAAPELDIASDFVEDDEQYRFTFKSPADGIELAKRVKRQDGFSPPSNLRVRMIELPSIEKVKASRQGQGSVRAFWLEYFAPLDRRWTPIDSMLESGSATD